MLFLIGLVCVAVTMLIGLSLEETIRSRAGEIWHAKLAPRCRNGPVDPKSTLALQTALQPECHQGIPVFRLARVANDLYWWRCAAFLGWLWWKYPRHR